MSVLMIFRIALKALDRNKMRTALTMLGMIIGVAAVITMVALGTGAQIVDRGADSVGRHQHDHVSGRQLHAGRRAPGPGQRQHARRRTTRRRSRSCRACSTRRPASNTRGQIVAGNQNWNTQVQGTDVDLPLIRSWPIERRRVLHAAGRRRPRRRSPCSARVVRDQLFGADVDPVGQVIRISNQPFTVVGVMASKGQSGMGQDQDDVIFVPYTTVMKKLRGITFIQQVTVSAASAGETTHGRRPHRRAAARAPQDSAGRPRRLHGAHDGGDGQRPQGSDADDDGAARRASPACRCSSAASAS